MMKYIKIFSKDNIYFIKFNEIMYKIHNNSLNLLIYFFYGDGREKGRLGFGLFLYSVKWKRDCCQSVSAARLIANPSGSMLAYETAKSKFKL